MPATDSEPDKKISLEVRTLSEIYRINKGQAGRLPVSPFELTVPLRCEEEEAISTLRDLSYDGYVSRPFDKLPEMRFSDPDALYNLTEKGVKQYESLCDAFEPNETQEKIIEVIRSNRAMSLTAIATEFSAGGVTIEEVEELLDELAVYSRLDLKGSSPFTGTYVLSK